MRPRAHARRWQADLQVLHLQRAQLALPLPLPLIQAHDGPIHLQASESAKAACIGCAAARTSSSVDAASSLSSVAKRGSRTRCASASSDAASASASASPKPSMMLFGTPGCGSNRTGVVVRTLWTWAGGGPIKCAQTEVRANQRVAHFGWFRSLVSLIRDEASSGHVAVAT